MDLAQGCASGAILAGVPIVRDRLLAPGDVFLVAEQGQHGTTYKVLIGGDVEPQTVVDVLNRIAQGQSA